MTRGIGLEQPPVAATAFRFPRWRLLLLTLLLAALYAQVLARLVLQWYQNPDYSHGFLVPLLAGYIVWRKRYEWDEAPREPSWLGLPIVVGSLGLLYLGNLGAEQFLARVSLWFVILGLIMYFEGSRRLRTISFPVAFLLFMIPLPAMIYNQIVFPLQLLASRCATRSLEAINLFPVLREGNLLLLPNYTLEVVEACSGIRSLMALLGLASVYGFLMERNLLLRIVLIIAMVPVAIAANAIRVMALAFCTQFWGIEVAESMLHPISGILIFCIATVMLLALHAAIVLLQRRFGSVPR